MKKTMLSVFILLIWGCVDQKHEEKPSSSSKNLSEDKYSELSLSQYLCSNETIRFFDIEKILNYPKSSKDELYEILSKTDEIISDGKNDSVICLKKTLTALVLLGDESDYTQIIDYTLLINRNISYDRLFLSFYAIKMLGSLVAKDSIINSNNNNNIGLNFLLNCSDNKFYWPGKLDKISINDNYYLSTRKNIILDKMNIACIEGLTYTMSDIALKKLESIRDSYSDSEDILIMNLTIDRFTKIKSFNSIVDYYISKNSGG